MPRWALLHLWRARSLPRGDPIRSHVDRGLARPQVERRSCTSALFVALAVPVCVALLAAVAAFASVPFLEVFKYIPKNIQRLQKRNTLVLAPLFLIGLMLWLRDRRSAGMAAGGYRRGSTSGGDSTRRLRRERPVPGARARALGGTRGRSRMAFGRLALHMHARLPLRARDARTGSCSHVLAPMVFVFAVVGLTANDTIRWAPSGKVLLRGGRRRIGSTLPWASTSRSECSGRDRQEDGSSTSPRHRVVFVGEFFNRSIGDVYELGSPMPYGLPSTQVHWRPVAWYSKTADQPTRRARSGSVLRACRGVPLARDSWTGASCFVCTDLFARPSQDRPRVRGGESRERFRALGSATPVSRQRVLPSPLLS